MDYGTVLSLFVPIIYWLVVCNMAGLWLSIQLGIIIPTDELIFFRGVGIPPTRYYWVCLRELYGRGKLELPSKFHELVVSVKKPPNRPFFGVESTRRSELKEPAAQTAVAVWDSHGKGWGNHRLGWFDGHATGTDWLEVPIPYRRPIFQA